MDITIENFEHGVTREWHYNRRLVVYRTTSSSRDAADTWAKVVRETIATWPKGQPFLALYDFRKLGLTPYNREISIQVAQSFPPDFEGRYATVVARDVLGHAIRLFGTRELGKVVPQLRGSYFFTIEEGLDWLREMLPAEGD